jgi:hypothetical protein
MFKTQLCLHFTKKGACWYGDQCNFAHGKSELRDNKPAPKPAPMQAPKPAPMQAPATNSFVGFTYETDDDTDDETDDETETKFSWANEMENDFTFMNATPCR